jgi:hypothetical protein
LVIVLKAVWVFTITAIGRSSARLYIGSVPGLWSDRAQERGWMKSAGAYFHIEWLHQYAALICPISLQAVDKILKSHENPVV